MISDSKTPAYLGNVIMKPLRAHFSRSASVVPIVVARHVLEHSVHSLRRHMREKRLDEPLMCQGRQVCHSVSRASRVALKKGRGERLTSFTGPRGLCLLRVEVLMVRNVDELLPQPAQAQLVTLCHQFRPRLAKNVQEPRLGELSCSFGLKRKQCGNGVRMRLESRENIPINDVLCVGIRYIYEDRLKAEAEAKRDAEKEHKTGGKHGA